jgi:hypothetical protein
MPRSKPHPGITIFSNSKAQGMNPVEREKEYVYRRKQALRISSGSVREAYSEFAIYQSFLAQGPDEASDYPPVFPGMGFQALRTNSPNPVTFNGGLFPITVTG